MFRAHNSKASRQRGSILVCVLVSMGIVTTIALVAVRSSLQVRRQMRQEVQLEQTRWLLDAGLARGKQQLRKAADYQGETWQVTPALAGYPQASVEIAIIDDDSAPDGPRQLRVTAQLGPSDVSSVASVGSTRRSDSIIIPSLPTSSDNG